MVNSINVYDINLNRVGVLYTWISMFWNEGYNTMGQFQLELQRTDWVIELVKKDRYYGIADSDTLMYVVSVDIEDNTVIVNGFPATVILEHRVSDAVISNADAETAMRELVSNMDPWERVELGPFNNLGIRYSPQISDKSLEEYCENIGAECDIGFKFVHDRENKKLLFTCYQPEKNVNAKYASKFGNVTDIEYLLSDAEYKNVAMVAGAGEGDERITVMVGDTSLTGYQRRELYIDARNEQPEEEESTSDYIQRLIKYGEGKLVEQERVEAVSFAVTNNVGLGDLVHVNLPEIALRLDARVAEITIQSENNGTTKEITVGTPFNITRLKGDSLWRF